MFHIIHLFILFLICLSQLKCKLHKQTLSLATVGELLWPSCGPPLLTGLVQASSSRFKGWLFMVKVMGSVQTSWWSVPKSVKQKGGVMVGQGLLFKFLYPSPTNIWGRLVHEGRGFCLFCSLIYLQCLGHSLVPRKHLIHVCWMNQLSKILRL